MKNLTKIDKIVLTIGLFFAIWAAIAIPMRIYTWYNNQEIFDSIPLYSEEYYVGYGATDTRTYSEDVHPILKDKLIEKITKQSFVYAAIIYLTVLLIIGTITQAKKTSSKR